jgi:alpha-glucosidase (family GH31 glycosyl hydrolase)
MDIGYSVDNMYFAFDQRRYSKKGIEIMNQVIDYSDRKVVIITDPHIKSEMSYRVYK